MKKKLFKSTISISLAAVLTLMSACGSSGSTTSSSQSASSQTASTSEAAEDPSAKPPVYSDKVAFSDRDTDSFNEAAFEARCQEFSELSKTEGNADELNSLYDEIVAWLDCLSSDQSIAYYKYSVDVTNTEAASLETSLETLYSEKLDEFCKLCRDVLNSDTYHDSFADHIGETAVTTFSEYVDLTDEMQSLKQKAIELNQSYNELRVKDITDESIQDQIADIYIDLVNTNNQLAECYGYDNYADYSFQFYARDYDASQIDSIKDSVSENIIPLYYAYSNKAAESDCTDASTSEYEVSESDMKKIPSLLEEIDPSLSDSFNYLLDEGLYNLEASDTKTGFVFTSPMYSYKDAYILFAPTGYASDITPMIHEFGHFNNFYSADYDSINTSTAVDVCEIHSQALELLFSDFYPDLNSTYGESLKQTTYNTMLYTILTSFVIYEAESTAYSTEDLTAEKLDQIWADAEEKYGMTGTFSNGNWVQISHIFQNPCYYIGYATSALASLEVYTLSRDDWDGAVDCYLQLSAMKPGKKFCETLESVGLTDIFSADAIETLCTSLADAWEISDMFPIYKEAVSNTSSDAA